MSALDIFPTQCYVVKVADDCMADEHIIAGDNLLVDCAQKDVSDGCLVVIRVDDEEFIVRLYRASTPVGFVRVVRSPKHESMLLPSSAFEVRGSVIGLLRKVGKS